MPTVRSVFMFELRAAFHWIYDARDVVLLKIISRGEFGEIHLRSGLVLTEVPRATCEALHQWILESLELRDVQPVHLASLEPAAGKPGEV